MTVQYIFDDGAAVPKRELRNELGDEFGLQETTVLLEAAEKDEAD